MYLSRFCAAEKCWISLQKGWSSGMCDYSSILWVYDHLIWTVITSSNEPAECSHRYLCASAALCVISKYNRFTIWGSNWIIFQMNSEENIVLWTACLGTVLHLCKGRKHQDGLLEAGKLPLAEWLSRSAEQQLAVQAELSPVCRHEGAQGNTVKGWMVASSCSAATHLSALCNPFPFAPFPPSHSLCQPSLTLKGAMACHWQENWHESCAGSEQHALLFSWSHQKCLLPCHSNRLQQEEGQEQREQRAELSTHSLRGWVSSPQMLSKCRDGYCIKQGKEEQTCWGCEFSLKSWKSGCLTCPWLSSPGGTRERSWYQ